MQMKKRNVALMILLCLILSAGIGYGIHSRPVTGIWVSIDPITEKAMLVDEVTRFELHPDKTMYVTIQADYLGRYEWNEGQGIWNTSGDRIFLSTGKLNRFSCVWGEPCTWSREEPREYRLVHNILSDILMIDGREDVRFIRHPSRTG